MVVSYHLSKRMRKKFVTCERSQEWGLLFVYRLQEYLIPIIRTLKVYPVCSCNWNDNVFKYSKVHFPWNWNIICIAYDIMQCHSISLGFLKCETNLFQFTLTIPHLVVELVWVNILIKDGLRDKYQQLVPVISTVKFTVTFLFGSDQVVNIQETCFSCYSTISSCWI